MRKINSKSDSDIRANFKVDSIAYREIKPWLLKKHYAHRIPSISYAFGLYDIGGILCGVCSFGSPASPFLVKGILGEKIYQVLELNRLCVNDNLPRNALSYFVSQCLKRIPKPMIVVSYADTAHNHHGYIYQATNWIYTGLSSPHKEYKIDGLSNIHSRHIFDKSANGGVKRKLILSIDCKVNTILK